MQQLLNRFLNALVGFLLGAFKSPDPNKPLPPPPPFPVGTPPTPPPTAPSGVPPTGAPPGSTQPQAVNALKWNHAVTLFMQKWAGKYVPPKFGGNFQCVALVNEWTQETWNVYWPRLAAAGDFVNYNVPGFEFIKNTATNYPYPGDIVEWGRSPTLPWGHIGVAVASTVMHIDSFDQNWPIGSPAHVQGHSYIGVSGWHRRL